VQRASTSKSRKFIVRRFSIKSLFGLLAFVALILALVSSMLTNRQLEKELVTLRKEGGHLGRVDTSKVNVVPVPQHDRHRFQWRVFVPKGRRIRILFNQANVPQHGLPVDRNHVLESFLTETPIHGSLLTAAIVSRSEGRSELRVSFGGTALYAVVPEGAHDAGSTVFRGCGRENTDLNERLVLFRRHFGSGVKESPGLMIWIEWAD